MSSSEWKEVCLGDIGEIVTGKTPSTKIKDNFGENYPFITPRDIKEQKNIIETERYLSEKGLHSVRNQVLNGITICVSCIGSDMGKVIIVKGKCVTNQQINAITSIKEKYNPDFIYYKLKPMKKYFHKIAGGSTMPIINKFKFSDIKIKVPKLEEQKQIATILSSFDDKIELNCQINKNLEQIAQAIFKHWFIDFEFPNENGEPYKFSGGEMINSELGAIPKEWVVIPFKEIIKISSGKRPKEKKNEKNKKYNTPLIGASSVMGYVSKILYIKPILVIGRVGTHGIVQRIKEKSWPSDNTLVIQPEYYEYTYQILKNINYQSLNRGSTQPLITQTDIKKYKIIFLKNNLLSDFEKIVGSLFQLINKNKEENRILSRIRDILLPKLMSGEIRII